MIQIANKESIEKASLIIKQGGVVAFPTETVYGLGADGLNPIAVSKIFEVKRRPAFNPLILHIDSLEMFEKLTSIKNERLNLLINNFWPGALTVVVPKNKFVPDIVTSGNSTVAIRMPNHSVALELIKLSGTPIAAPSANRFGKLSPTTAQHVQKQLGDKLDLILDGGQSSVGLESTIIEISNEDIFLLRFGGISIDEIESIVGTISFKKQISKTPDSPGQLLIHYAPEIPIKFIDEITESDIKNKKLGGLFFKKASQNYSFKTIKLLSSSGNLNEASVNFFSMLHELESSEIDIILAEKIPEIGLGCAIMDRLKKAVNNYR